MKDKAILKENELLKKQISELYIIINNNEFYEVDDSLGLCDNFYNLVQKAKQLNVDLEEIKQKNLELKEKINNNFLFKVYLKVQKVFKNGKK